MHPEMLSVSQLCHSKMRPKVTLPTFPVGGTCALVMSPNPPTPVIPYSYSETQFQERKHSKGHQGVFQMNPMPSFPSVLLAYVLKSKFSRKQKVCQLEVVVLPEGMGTDFQHRTSSPSPFNMTVQLTWNYCGKHRTIHISLRGRLSWEHLYSSMTSCGSLHPGTCLLSYVAMMKQDTYTTSNIFLRVS